MRFSYLILFMIITTAAIGQKSDVLDRMKRFHQMMVTRDFILDNYIHDSLTYGHSNGWIESSREFRSNLGNSIIYHSYKEDSIRATVTKRTAHIRFIAGIDATLNGKRTTYHLSVLEVWVRERRTWKLFARQAVKAG